MHRPRLVRSSPIIQSAPPDPHAPVVFEDRSGVIVAKLGCVIVGMVHRPTAPSGLAWWSCFLPDTPRVAQYVYSIDVAKDRLADRARDWIDAAGLRL